MYLLVNQTDARYRGQQWERRVMKRMLMLIRRLVENLYQVPIPFGFQSSWKF